ncbi:MAG: glycosyltransferase, partial [Nitrospinae bacterium]|nr:glycosyltransferase [Nitrospinota bacterium]
MKVLMISKALVNGAYHNKLKELTGCSDIQLTLIVPEKWSDTVLEKRQSDNYKVIPSRIIFNGYNHFHWYPSLSGLFKDIRPDIVHIDEEHYSFITFQAMRLAKKIGAKAIFFTWQNLYKKYPPPFSWIEKYNLKRADFAIAGNREAKNILLKKGFSKEAEVIPQFGVNPQIFKKDDIKCLKKELNPENKFTIGFVGRLVHEKGIGDLLDAVLNAGFDSHLLIIGAGPLKSKIIGRTKGAGISHRVKIIDRVPSLEIYKYFNCMDCMVLPSLTMPNW